MRKYAIFLTLPLAAVLAAQDSTPKDDKAIKDKLAAPPVFLDEQHQGVKSESFFVRNALSLCGVQQRPLVLR